VIAGLFVPGEIAHYRNSPLAGVNRTVTRTNAGGV